MLKRNKRMAMIGVMISFSATTGCVIDGTYEEPRHVLVEEPVDECTYETAEGFIVPLDGCTIDRVAPVY